jgi:16S rRNA (cytosine967-C5)-methyltransferase
VTSAEPTAADARGVALETARRVTRGALLSRELGRALDRADLPPRERALATDLAYGALRWRIWLDAALAPRLREPERLPEAVREALRLGAYEILRRGTPPHAAVHSWVEVARRHAPRLTGLVNAVLRRVEPPADPDPATRVALPRWMWRHLEAALGDRAEAAALAMRAPGPLWLSERADGAVDALREEGAEVEAGPIPGTLRVRPGRPLAQLRAFRDGLVQPQNPASAWVADALGASPGARVLDLASGRGVKAARLAAAGGRVEAVEAREAHVAQARRNLARLGLAATHRVADLRTPPADLEPAPYVLLDAPCTGTGTLRGHPELAFRLAPDDVADRAALQDRLLDTAAALTAPGGRLVYAVCSLTREEGPERVAALRARRPAFRPEPLAPPLPHRAAGDGAFLLPEGGLDGFFVARLRCGEGEA